MIRVTHGIAGMRTDCKLPAIMKELGSYKIFGYYTHRLMQYRKTRFFCVTIITRPTDDPDCAEYQSKRIQETVLKYYPEDSSRLAFTYSVYDLTEDTRIDFVTGSRDTVRAVRLLLSNYERSVLEWDNHELYSKDWLS